MYIAPIILTPYSDRTQYVVYNIQEARHNARNIVSTNNKSGCIFILAEGIDRVRDRGQKPHICNKTPETRHMRGVEANKNLLGVEVGGYIAYLESAISKYNDKSDTNMTST